MTDKKQILIVEDDPAISHALSLNLQIEGYQCEVVVDGETAMLRIAADQPDLVMLDIGIPKKNGLELLRELREAGDDTPVIVLSARQEEVDKVAALRLGADDYVTKPFGLAELLARVVAVLRRASVRAGGEPDPDERSERVFRFGDVTLDLDTRRVARGGQPVSLTHLEFELLSFFVRHPSKVFSRVELLRKVWGLKASGSQRTVDNFVAQLRSKLEDDPESPRHLVTVRGSGYRFDP